MMIKEVALNCFLKSWKNPLSNISTWEWNM